MLRVFLIVLCTMLVAAAAWVVSISIDTKVPFSSLELTGLRLDARADGRVFVSFAWVGPTRGKCTRVRGDVAVGVGGEVATVERLGGGRWGLGPLLPLPRHVCDNQAVFGVAGRALVPGVVAAVLGDGRGNPAVIAARDLFVPPSLVVESPQPAHANERAVVAVLPAEHALAMWPSVERDADAAWPVEIEGPRAAFRVPPRWRAGDGVVRVRADRVATHVRCERASGNVPPCAAYALPVDATVPFAVATSPAL